MTQMWQQRVRRSSHGHHRNTKTEMERSSPMHNASFTSIFAFASLWLCCFHSQLRCHPICFWYLRMLPRNGCSGGKSCRQHSRFDQGAICEVSQLSHSAADDAYDATRSWLEADRNRRYDAFCHHPPVYPFSARLMTREYSPRVERYQIRCWARTETDPPSSCSIFQPCDLINGCLSVALGQIMFLPASARPVYGVP
jgi:hypothetical protein